MNERDLFRALGDIDPELLPEPKAPARRLPRRGWIGLALAACLCIAILPAMLRTTAKKSAEAPEALTMDAAVVSGEKEGAADPALRSTLPSANGIAAPAAYGVPTPTGAPESADAVESAEELYFRLEWEGGIYESIPGILYLPDRMVELELDAEQLDEIAWLLTTLPEPEDITYLDEPEYLLDTPSGSYAWQGREDPAIYQVCQSIRAIIESCYTP